MKSRLLLRFSLLLLVILIVILQAIIISHVLLPFTLTVLLIVRIAITITTTRNITITTMITHHLIYGHIITRQLTIHTNISIPTTVMGRFRLRLTQLVISHPLVILPSQFVLHVSVTLTIMTTRNMYRTIDINIILNSTASFNVVITTTLSWRTLLLILACRLVHIVLVILT